MKRLWVLLLICLLPVQVFAAVLTYASSVAATDFSAPVEAAVVIKQIDLSKSVAALPAADEAQQAAIGDTGSTGDDSTGYADNGEDFSTHAGIGDEPVLVRSLAVLPQTSRLAPALHSDDASQPPYLPPAARPPRA